MSKVTKAKGEKQNIKAQSLRKTTTTSTKTRQQHATNDAVSLWTNQLKICPPVIAKPPLG